MTANRTNIFHIQISNSTTFFACITRYILCHTSNPSLILSFVQVVNGITYLFLLAPSPNTTGSVISLMLCRVDVRTMKRMIKRRKQRCRAAMSNNPVCRANSSRVTPSVTPLQYIKTWTVELNKHMHTVNIHHLLLPVHDIMVLESIESSKVELTETQKSQSRIRHHKC